MFHTKGWLSFGFSLVCLAFFFFFLPKELQEVSGNKPGIVFQKLYRNHLQSCFLLLNLYWLLGTLEKVVCYRSAEVKIPAVFNNLQLLLGSKYHQLPLFRAEKAHVINYEKKTTCKSLLSISGKFWLHKPTMGHKWCDVSCQLHLENQRFKLHSPGPQTHICVPNHSHSCYLWLF